MRSAVDSILDVMITVLVIVSCISFFYATYTKLLNNPSLGFGILAEKSSVKTDAYAEGDAIEYFNRYQVACTGLVNSVDTKVDTYSETQKNGVIADSGLRQFSFRFQPAAGNVGSIRLNSTRVPWLSTYSQHLWDTGYDVESHGTHMPISASYSADIIDEKGTLLFYTTVE